MAFHLLKMTINYNKETHAQREDAIEKWQSAVPTA
jgi:hypothetical protein